MYSTDLAPYAYYTSRPFPKVMTVGWLDSAHSFSEGIASEALIEKLQAIMRGNADVSVHVNVIRGIHPCNICGEVRFEDRTLRVGSSEIWISDGAGGYFASPSMILHYITKHKYLPPRVFLNAIEAFDLAEPYNAQREYERLAIQVG